MTEIPFFGYNGWSICVCIGIKMKSHLLIRIKPYRSAMAPVLVGVPFISVGTALSVLLLKSFLTVVSRTLDVVHA
jgi:hypothetical protein